MHCILKVDSFSVLQSALSGSDCNYFESTEFTASGYTRVMSVYPNGNKKDQGGDHLSLYVSMIDEISRGDLVRVHLQFFVYDQTRDNYLSVQYVRDKRFYAMKSTWGIPQFLSLVTFSDASNGFLVNDRCVFGAEVLLPDGCLQTPSLSIIGEQYDRVYTWRIEKFSGLVDSLESPEFCFDEWTWALHLYPKGIRQASGNSLSLFLELKNSGDLIRGSKLYAKYCMFIKNQEKGVDYSIKTDACHWFTSESTTWGYRKFLPLDVLRKLQKGFLVEDTLVVEVRMKLMFLLKDKDYNEEQ